MAQLVKNPPVNAWATGDAGSIPGWGRLPGGGHGNPLQHSCLENPMDRGAWLATVHGVAKSLTQLKSVSMHSCVVNMTIHCLCKSTGVDCHFLLQRTFPTQGLNPGLLHCRQTLYCLSHQEVLSLLIGISNCKCLLSSSARCETEVLSCVHDG